MVIGLPSANIDEGRITRSSDPFLANAYQRCRHERLRERREILYISGDGKTRHEKHRNQKCERTSLCQIGAKTRLEPAKKVALPGSLQITDWF